MTSFQRLYDVETTSCVYGDIQRFFHFDAQKAQTIATTHSLENKAVREEGRTIIFTETSLGTTNRIFALSQIHYPFCQSP